MGYLVQKTRAASLTINGDDYTSSLVSFQVSDASANRNGLITTTGQLVLGQRPGLVDIADYDRNTFKRGTPVILDVTEPGGSAYRHPRGYLYVMSVLYSVEQEQLIVELGCKLALAYLNDDVTDVYPLIPIPLDEAQRTIQNCSASFAAAGQYLFQDNQGNLVSGEFFDGDDNSGVAAGEWTSVLGQTALSVQPLAGADAIPDKITLSYNVPSDGLTDNTETRVDSTTETSKYFLTYPAATWERKSQTTCSRIDSATGKVTEIYCIENPDESDGGTAYPNPSGGGTSACGNQIDPPTSAPNQPLPTNRVPVAVACNYGWETVPSPTFVPATKIAVSTTEYNAPGGQVSLRRQEVYGPAIETNQQYFADKFAYCVQLYGYACNPNGSCEMEGLETVLQSYTVTENFYGEANELVKTVQETYNTKLSAAQPFDWRSGTVNGVPQDFNNSLTTDDMYRATQVVTETSKSGGVNEQLTTTFTSMATRQTGINNGELDALKGIKTTVKRLSSTTAALELRPDSVNTVTTNTTERSTLINITVGAGYITPPTEAGPYIIEESIPVPLLFDTEEAVEEKVETYSDYLARFVKGDLYGLQIGEALRSDLVTNWKPGMPFRYADTANDQIMAMRMDACAWGVTNEESIVVTNGVWLGFSSGSLSLGSNLVGNSRPDMGSGVTPPTAPALPPSIDNDVVGQSFQFDVEVNLNLSVGTVAPGVDGIVPLLPSDLSSNREFTITVFTSGAIVETGGLISTTGTGSIPTELGGSLITTTATLVDADVFS